MTMTIATVTMTMCGGRHFFRPWTTTPCNTRCQSWRNFVVVVAAAAAVVVVVVAYVVVVVVVVAVVVVVVVVVVIFVLVLVLVFLIVIVMVIIIVVVVVAGETLLAELPVFMADHYDARAYTDFCTLPVAWSVLEMFVCSSQNCFVAS